MQKRKPGIRNSFKKRKRIGLENNPEADQNPNVDGIVHGIRTGTEAKSEPNPDPFSFKPKARLILAPEADLKSPGFKLKAGLEVYQNSMLNQKKYSTPTLIESGLHLIHGPEPKPGNKRWEKTEIIDPVSSVCNYCELEASFYPLPKPNPFTVANRTLDT